MKSHYAVKNPAGKMFTGFDSSGVAVWGSENNAKSYVTKLEAQAQANLFKAMGVRVQIKPEVI